MKFLISTNTWWVLCLVEFARVLQTLVDMLKLSSKPRWRGMFQKHVLETCSVQSNFRIISRATYYPGSFLVACIFISTRGFGLENVCEETCKCVSVYSLYHSDHNHSCVQQWLHLMLPKLLVGFSRVQQMMQQWPC